MRDHYGISTAMRRRTHHRKYFQGVVLWDTGATGCVITQEVVDTLKLASLGMTEVKHAEGKSMHEVYLINIALPNNVMYEKMKVTKAKLPEGTIGLIGMNVITSGDFAITNHGGKTIMSFRFLRLSASTSFNPPTPPQHSRVQ